MNPHLVPAVTIKRVIDWWFTEHRSGSLQSLADATGVDLETLRRIRSGKVRRVTFSTADKVLTRAGAVHLWHTELADFYQRDQWDDWGT